MRQVGRLRPNDPVWVGRYRLVGRLGTGGQGVVYLARDLADRFVAVKTLHADFIEDSQAAARFVRELAAAQKVAPFCTAQVLHADINPDQPYIVSEYIDGPSLKQAITGRGPLAGNELHRLAIATATALAAIHEAA
jgi:serine/threonine protein kinase